MLVKSKKIAFVGPSRSVKMVEKCKTRSCPRPSLPVWSSDHRRVRGKNYRPSSFSRALRPCEWMLPSHFDFHFHFSPVSDPPVLSPARNDLRRSRTQSPSIQAGCQPAKIGWSLVQWLSWTLETISSHTVVSGSRASLSREVFENRRRRG